MRRKDREVTDREAIEAFIARQQILRIGFYDDGEVYIVPVNYGYVYENQQYVFYFHGAKAGRKYELTQRDPVVGFEIDGNYQVMEHENACKCSAAFQSVIGTGTLSLVENTEEKKLGLDALMKQATGQTTWTYAEQSLEGVAVYKLEVHKLSCKAKY